MSTPIHNVVEYYQSQGWRVTSPYGNRKDPWGSGATVFHPGIDFGDKPAGHPVRTPFPGTVTIRATQRDAAGKIVGAGHYVGVRIEGQSIIMCFFHLQSQAVNVGQKLKAGDIIGYNGSSGNSTAAHLHFELRKGTASLGSGVWGDPTLFRMAQPTSKKFDYGAWVKSIASVELNMRKSPGTAAAVVTQLQPGATGQVLQHKDNGAWADGHHWWYVRAGKHTGWLAESFLAVVVSTVYKVGDWITSNITIALNVRDGRGLEAKVVAQLQQGEKANVISSSHNGRYADGYHWWYIELGNGKKGWVAERLIKKTTAPPPQPEPKPEPEPPHQPTPEPIDPESGQDEPPGHEQPEDDIEDNPGAEEPGLDEPPAQTYPGEPPDKPKQKPKSERGAIAQLIAFIISWLKSVWQVFKK